jgi:hypothetical protein
VELSTASAKEPPLYLLPPQRNQALEAAMAHRKNSSS